MTHSTNAGSGAATHHSYQEFLTNPAEDSVISALNRWKFLNLTFEENRYNGPTEGPALATASGTKKICLCAIHAVNHYRSLGEDEGSFKPADLFTGGLALMLAELHQLHAVVNRRRVPSMNPHRGRTDAETLLFGSPTFTKDMLYLDMHGSKDERPFAIALGTAGLPSKEQKEFIKRVLFHAEVHSLGHVAVNPKGYTAAPHTLTNHLRVNGYTSVLQIEIARRLRFPGDVTSNAANLVRFFDDLLNP